MHHNAPSLDVERVIDCRPGIRGWEFQVRFRNTGASPSYRWAAEADLIANSSSNKQKLDKFKLQHRRTQVLDPTEAGPTRKRSRHQLPDEQRPASGTSKRRHTSASSVDNTPEYEPPSQQLPDSQPLQMPEQPRKRQRQPSSVKSRERIEKVCTTRKLKEKIHSSTKDITGASLLSGQPRERASASSGLVSTRKVEQQKPQSLSAFQKSTNLSEALLRPPLEKPLVVAIRELQLAQPSRDSLGPPPDTAALHQLVAVGDSVALFNAASRAGPAALTSHLVTAAAHAGPFASALLLSLLAAGASPNVTNSNGFTPLMLVARAGNAAATYRLLQFGAIPENFNSSDQSALMLAVHGQQWDAAAALLRHGAEFELVHQSLLDSKQLSDWIDSITKPLLSAFRLRAQSIVAAQLPHLFSVAPGGLRAFKYSTLEGLAESDSQLILAGLIELDGLGGVRLRRPVGQRLLARLELNGHELKPLASADCLEVYPADEAAAAPGETNHVQLAFSPDGPARCRHKLLLLPVCCNTFRSGAGPG